MNKSLSYVNLSLELHVVSIFWLGSGTGSFYYILSSHHMNLRDYPWRCTYFGTDICSCKLSAKVSLMLDNPFPVPSLCKLNHISVCSIQISTKITCKQLIPFRESHIFWSDPRCVGPLSKCQHNIEIFSNTARVSRLSFRFLWLMK